MGYSGMVMANPYLGQLADTPATLERIIDCVRPELYDEATDPGRFTLREAVAHLADFEDVFLDRLRLAVERPGATVEGIDEGERAVAKKYAERDVRHELTVFANRRRDTVTFLNELDDAGRGREFVHAELGRFTVASYACTMLGHDLYHLAHASQYLKKA
jgi:hypothetical protein